MIIQNESGLAIDELRGAAGFCLAGYKLYRGHEQARSNHETSWIRKDAPEQRP